MLLVRRYLLLAALGLAWFGLQPLARADAIHEPNNSPGKSFPLPGGQMIVSDDLNADVGRPEVLLAQFSPTFSTLLAMGSPAPGVGNGLGSQLFDVPLFSNGQAFFKITGAPDSTFVGSHVQDGPYSITYDVYNPAHELVKTVTNYEDVDPGMVDTAWLLPDASIPDWTGYTTDVVVNNVVGPGDGDSLDFFTFTGLEPFMPFTAKLTDVAFDAMIGLYDGDTLVGTGTPVGGVLTLNGVADAAGNVKIGITGAGDGGFVGAHAEVGTYTLEVLAVPEPAAAVLLGSAAAAVGCLLLRKRLRGARHKRTRIA